MPRSAIEGEKRSVPLMTLITPTTRNRMERAMSQGDNVSALLRDLLMDYLDEYEEGRR